MQASAECGYTIPDICVLGESRRHREETALASRAPFLVPLLSLEEKLGPHVGWAGRN